jgi:hypothetical protein
VGAADQRQAVAHREAFSEQDQTALYSRANAAKSQARKGLGSRSAKAKASQWQGTKVSFDSEEVRFCFPSVVLE